MAAHSFAGNIVSEAGDDPKVSSLAYVAARAPDADEDFGALATKFPKPPVTGPELRFATLLPPEGDAMNPASTFNQELKASCMPSAVPIVFVVDDDVSVRKSLGLLIQSAGCRPETFASAEEFLSRPRVLTPSCLVLEVTLAVLNGLDLQQRIAADRVDMPIIFITGQGDVPTTVRAMKAGAAEFLTKPLDDDELLGAIRDAVDRSDCVLRQEAQMRLLRNRYASLTARERKVMELVVNGEMNKQVGGKLGISEITVKAHRGKMMRKMKAGSLADLVNMAARLRPPSVPTA